MLENNIADVIIKMKILFSNRIFIANLKDARNNWLDIPVADVLKNILTFLESIATEVASI